MDDQKNSRDERLLFPATTRNRDFIGDALSQVLPRSGTVLEIASGSGEHGVAFQKRFQEIIWQTSDPDEIYRKSISSWIEHEGLIKQMPEPLDLDVEKRPWPLLPELRSSIKFIMCANMIHISPWNSTKALFEGSAELLVSDQHLMLYGPFKIEGQHTSKSNFYFDKLLKEQNYTWGVRDLGEVTQIAINNGFYQYKVISMPANNLSVIYKMN